jgi:hypothetical protein
MQARSNLKRQLAAQGQSAAAGAIRSDAMGVVASIMQEDGALGFWKGERAGATTCWQPGLQQQQQQLCSMVVACC